MVCRVVLINSKNNKEVKEEFWSDTYPVCLERVKSLNEIKSLNEKYWNITTINC